MKPKSYTQIRFSLIAWEVPLRVGLAIWIALVGPNLIPWHGFQIPQSS
jgi:hypothetical protein